MANNEQWQPIPGWETLYSASDMGRIRSERRGNILAGYLRKDGRRQFCLTDGVQLKTRLGYHLVLESFAGPRPPGYEGRHLNDDPGDDRLVNLAWGSSSQNKQDRIRNTKRTSCVNGHRYTAATTYWYGMTRHCRICRATPSAKTCSIKECSKAVLARRLCSKHYNRQYRHGDPLKVPTRA